MKKWSSSLALMLLGSFCLAQTADMVPVEVRRVGDSLACLCGSCKNTVATCTMLGCHYSAPAREKIVELSKQGVSDEAIVADFVKREGKKALASPPPEGFWLWAWLAPPIAALAGLGFVGLFIRKYRRPSAEPDKALSEADVARFQKAAERELSGIDE